MLGLCYFDAVFGREQKLDNGNTGMSEDGKSGRMCSVRLFFYFMMFFTTFDAMIV